MPKASPLQPSFNAGEISPEFYGRSDTEQYKAGLALCLNYLPSPNGPLLRRPGTKYVGNNVKDPSNPPVLIPFQASATDQYVLEFGHRYIRFYKNNGQVVVVGSTWLGSGIWFEPAITNPGSINGAFANDSNDHLFYFVRQGIPLARSGESALANSSFAQGAVLEMQSPFEYADLANIKFSGSYDTLYLTTGNRPIQKLQRFGEYDWTIRPVLPIDGPYMPFNSHTYPGDSASVTLTPSGADFKGSTTIKTGPVSSVANITNGAWGPNSSYAKIDLTVGNHNFQPGAKIVVTNDDGSFGTTFAPGRYNVDSITGSTVITVRAPGLINGSFSGSAFVYPSLFGDRDYQRSIGLSNGGKRYWGLINFNSSYGHIANFYPCSTLPNTSVITAWQLGVWRHNEWPKASTFHQDRLALAGNPGRPLEVALSTVAEYENFQTSNSSYVVTDKNAVQFTLNAQQLNAAQWVASDANGLLIGGISSEWKVSPSSQAAALTPTNINAVETSYFGSADAQPTKAGNAVLYIQRANRSLRELNYFFQVNTYRSTNMAELSGHITYPGIDLLANQKETQTAVWARTTAGGLVSMSYNRDEQTVGAGWAKHQLGGQSDSGGSAPQVLGMACIAGSGATFDQLWMVTKRFINGTSVVGVEYMTKPFSDTDQLIEDAFHVDYGATYDQPINISGISRAGSAIVTATAHGFSDGDLVKITKVVGMNTSIPDINGIMFGSNLVNTRVFRAGSVSANAFFLQDVNNGSSYIDSRSYSAYVSGGEARKLVSNITGLTWLIGEQVAILADGKIHPITQVGTGGTLALQYSAAKVQIGLPYNSDAKTLRLDAGSGDGTSIGKIRRPGRVAFQLDGVGDFAAGPSFDRLTPLSDVEVFRADVVAADTAPPLFSGIARESVESEYGFDGQICFRQSSPLPGTVQSITTILEENDV